MTYIAYEVRFHDHGTKEWLLNGKLHREDGPAVEYIDGTKKWFLNGKLHREDGPAVEFASGEKRWYLDNYNYTEADWKAEMEKRNPNSCEGKTITFEGKEYKLVPV